MKAVSMLVFIVKEEAAAIVLTYASDHNLTLEGNEIAAKQWAKKVGLPQPTQITSAYERT